MRAAIYARVSSAKQRDAHSIESQLLVLRRYVAQQGWSVAGEYIDDGRSAKAGKLEAREGFARLVRDAGARAFDVLVVLDVNRLTRTDDMRERAEILGTFQQLGIDIATPASGPQDLRTMLGEFYVTMQALVAAEENRKRVTAITAGKARAIAEGRKPAGPTPYGWNYSRAKGEWSLHPQHAAAIHEIFGRVIGGETMQSIADDLQDRELAPPGRGEWTKWKVWQIVRSRRALGEYQADKQKRVVLAIPPIVDRATWQAAQDALDGFNRRGLARATHVYLLEGLGVCSLCGSPMHIRSATISKRRGYANPAAYVCRDRKVKRRGAARCSSPILQVADVDARVWASVTGKLESKDLAAKIEARNRAIAENQRDWRADVSRYRDKLERLAKAEAAIAARYRKGSLSEEAFDLELEAAGRDRRSLEAQLRAAEDAVHAHAAGVAQVDAAAWVRSIRELARSTSPEARQRVVQAVVKGALFEAGRVILDMVVVAASPAVSDDDASARTIPSPAIAAGYRSEPGDGLEEPIRFRVVA